MRILSISAQKPSSTGSGVFLTELVKTFALQGHEQAVIAGVYQDDTISFPAGIVFAPVYFGTPQLPFPIAGMSDEMPYPSTRYCDMTPEMVRFFEQAFLSVLQKTLEQFRPDVILCHHLYLLTALVREQVRDIPVYGFCHNTDLRQMKKHGLERERIAASIRRLERIFVLRTDQKAEVEQIYGADLLKMTAIGMGYNKDIFYPVDTPAQIKDPENPKDTRRPLRLVYAGKIAEKKGVMSLLRSLDHLQVPAGDLELVCAGGAGNEQEYRQIRELAAKSPYPVSFPGRLGQPELADIYRTGDIFVLPSFYEGIPLTVIEALACGCRVVLSDLPGVREWLDEFVTGADIRYVQLPALQNTDEPVPEELPAFEQRLAEAIEGSISSSPAAPADVSRISWERIAQLVLKEL